MHWQKRKEKKKEFWRLDWVTCGRQASSWTRFWLVDCPVIIRNAISIHYVSLLPFFTYMIFYLPTMLLISPDVSFFAYSWYLVRYTGCVQVCQVVQGLVTGEITGPEKSQSLRGNIYLCVAESTVSTDAFVFCSLCTLFVMCCVVMATQVSD